MVAKQVSPQQSDDSLLLGSLVPQDNLYRRLKQRLDLTFLYAAVGPYYGPCGHQSIDPVVFRSGLQVYVMRLFQESQ